MPKINHAETLALVPVDDGNFKASLKAASFEDLLKAIAERRAQGHKSGLKVLEAELDRRAKSAGPTEVPLEVFSKDDPVGSLGRALEKLGKSVTDEMIVKAWGASQAAQEDFCLKRIRLGLYLWSVREVLKVKRGAWTKFRRHITKALSLKDEGTQIYDIVANAQRLIMVVAEGKTKSDTLRLRMESLAEGEHTSLIALDLDSPAGQAALAKMVWKSSLRELIRDLNESEKKADEMAEADAKKADKNKTEAKAEDKGEEKQPPGTPGDDGQMNFFNELFAAPIANIKTAYETACAKMSDADILATEAALKATLEVVTERANQAREREAEAKRQGDLAKRKLLTGAA